VKLRHTIFFAVLVSLVLSAGGARAQTDQTSPTARRHEGLFFRFALAQGIAAMTAEVGDAGDVETKITTTQRELRPSLGYALSENVILFGMLVAHESHRSTAKIGDLVPARESDHENVSGYGVGSTYYWMPINVYVSAALLAVSAYGDGTIGTTNRGLGLDLALGKEWWVSDGIGLGLSAQLLVARMREKLTTVQGEKPLWNRTGVSLGFSATFN
jgi:hypothetical protein